jgi:hypothetical protein
VKMLGSARPTDQHLAIVSLVWEIDMGIKIWWYVYIYIHSRIYIIIYICIYIYILCTSCKFRRLPTLPLWLLTHFAAQVVLLMFFGSLTLGTSAIGFNILYLEYDWIQEPLESLEMVIQCDLIHVYSYHFISKSEWIGYMFPTIIRNSMIYMLGCQSSHFHRDLD